MRDVESQNALLRRQLASSHKQLMSYAAVRPHRGPPSRKRVVLAEDDGDDDEGGDGRIGGARDMQEEDEDDEIMGRLGGKDRRPCLDKVMLKLMRSQVMC